MTSFLARKPEFYCEIEAPQDIFQSLEEWRNFSNPWIATDQVKKCIMSVKSGQCFQFMNYIFVLPDLDNLEWVNFFSKISKSYLAVQIVI